MVQWLADGADPAQFQTPQLARICARHVRKSDHNAHNGQVAQPARLTCWKAVWP
jgi:hypothetical protein